MTISLTATEVLGETGLPWSWGYDVRPRITGRAAAFAPFGLDASVRRQRLQ